MATFTGLPGKADPSWKGSVANVAALPSLKILGDTYLVLDEDKLYFWDGSAWTSIGADATIAHNDTTGKQGGDTSAYYHLDAADYNDISSNTQLDELNTTGSPRFSGGVTAPSLNPVNAGTLQLGNDSGKATKTEVGSSGRITQIMGETQIGDGTHVLRLGDEATEGSWRFEINGTSLEIQRYESGAWVVKQTIT